MEKVELDKLQIATLRLADTICGYFGGNSDVTTIADAHAIASLVKDIKADYVRNGLIEDFPLAGEEIHRDPHLEKTNRKHRLLSNFAKHADKDPRAFMTYNYTQAITCLYITCIDYENLFYELIDKQEAFVCESAIGNGSKGFGTVMESLLDIYKKWVEEWSKEVANIRGDTKLIPDYLELMEAASVEEMAQPTMEARTNKYFEIVRQGLRHIPRNGGVILTDGTDDPRPDYDMY